MRTRSVHVPSKDLAHDPKKCARFSDKIMRKIRNLERTSVSKETERALAALALCCAVLTAATARADFLDDLASPFKGMFQSKAPTAGVSTTRSPVLDSVVDCRVDIINGAAALRVYAGSSNDSGALRHQISIAETASECTLTPQGSIVARVGVAGRALLGPAGAAGTFTAPVTLLVKRGDTVVARRQRIVSVAIPASGQQAAFSFVEEGIPVPAGDGDLSIEAGIGNVPGGGEQHAKKKRR